MRGRYRENSLYSRVSEGVQLAKVRFWSHFDQTIAGWLLRVGIIVLGAAILTTLDRQLSQAAQYSQVNLYWWSIVVTAFCSGSLVVLAPRLFTVRPTLLGALLAAALVVITGVVLYGISPALFDYHGLSRYPLRNAIYLVRSMPVFLGLGCGVLVAQAIEI